MLLFSHQQPLLHMGGQRPFVSGVFVDARVFGHSCHTWGTLRSWRKLSCCLHDVGSLQNVAARWDEEMIPLLLGRSICSNGSCCSSRSRRCRGDGRRYSHSILSDLSRPVQIYLLTNEGGWGGQLYYLHAGVSLPKSSRQRAVRDSFIFLSEE